MKTIDLPVKDREALRSFKAGDNILLNGTVYTARDKVHDLTARKNKKWPFKIKGAGIYYCGPTPKLENNIIGSCGPTTSARMDPFTPALYRNGLAVTIGKGPRSKEVSEAIRKYRGLYIVAYGGCGALYSDRIKKAKIIGFESLGPQAVYKLQVRDFPAVVGIDCNGGNLFKR